jgi:hypothetical protein
MLSSGPVLTAMMMLVLGLVALIGCDRRDIPAIVQTLASWGDGKRAR